MRVFAFDAACVLTTFPTFKITGGSLLLQNLKITGALAWVVAKYLDWSAGYQENQITIMYDSMWDATRKMAEAIAHGVAAEDPNVLVKVYNTARADKNDIITEVFKSKAILVGSPAVNKGIFHRSPAFLKKSGD